MSDEVTSTTDDTHITIEGLTARIEALQKQNEEYLDGWKRAKADYINFKNDQEKRSKELAQFASLSLVVQLVPIAQHFRKAFGCITEELKVSDWVKGVEHIYRQFQEVLKGMGIEEVTGVVGKVFDPSSHMAVGQEQRDDFDDEVVSQEIEEGYMLHGRVIAPAKVIVNKKITS